MPATISAQQNRLKPTFNNLSEQLSHLNNNKTSFPTNGQFHAEGEKVNFEFEDSQGSDVSYQSSIQSEDGIEIGQIQYFKQEMARFFINYPELINHDIIDENVCTLQFNDADRGASLSSFSSFNRNRTLIADQILDETKLSDSYLQSLSRRMVLYNSKVHQEDLIDVLIKQQKNIMKEIQMQIKAKKQETKGIKNSMINQLEGLDNVYFSWRKKKEIENKLNLEKDSSKRSSISKKKDQRKDSIKRNSSSHARRKLLRSQSANRNRTNFKSCKRLEVVQPKDQERTFYQARPIKQTTLFIPAKTALNDQQLTNNIHSNHNSNQDHSMSRMDSRSLTCQNNKRDFSLSKNQELENRNLYNKKNFDKVQEQKGQKQDKVQFAPTSTQVLWKHLVNFEPKTQPGRQLCELIKKNNSPNDELGIKKTIMNYLVKNKQILQNEIILKSTILQKIQKLYDDDTKQLLMFYPTKILKAEGLGSNGASNDRNQQSDSGQAFQTTMGQNSPDMKDKPFDEAEKFMNLLEDIVEGPLMKYWTILQEKKL